MILWADSFDHYGTTLALLLDGAYAEASAGSISAVQARTGAHSYLTPGNALGGIRRVFGGAKTTVGVGYACYQTALPASPNARLLFGFRNAANVAQVEIGLDTTGIISVWRGPFGAFEGGGLGTKIGDSVVPVITANAWNHVEAKVTIGSGPVEVRVNGVTVINLVDVDTYNNGSPETSQVFIGITTGSSQDAYVDDVIAWDTSGSLNNDFIGDRKVITDFPTADTADHAWVPSTGTSSFGVIDDNPPNADTDYLTTTTVGDLFGVTFPNLPAAIVLIDGVIFIHKSKKTDAGAASIELHLKSGSSTSDGASRAITTAYTLYQDVFETDPATAAPFTRAGAQAAAFEASRTA